MIVLVICDGWGISAENNANAIAAARTPRFDALWQTFPRTQLSASGEDVGLPAGQMGNSEVGHLNLGAGRMVPQDILRIDMAIRDGSFFRNSALLGATGSVARNGSALHLMGLVSDGGVHSHENHLLGLLELARRENLKKVFIHAFLDGRDTPPKSAAKYLEILESAAAEKKTGAIATLAGRYYAMDRDKRWDRIEKAYRAIVFGEGKRAGSALEALEAAYALGQTDEFVLPAVIETSDGPVATLRSGDAVVFFNFRADRARELTQALTAPTFSEFDRGPRPDVSCVCLTEYKKEFHLPVAFPPVTPHNNLAQVWERAKIRNLRLAETEKYAHVTYFFNGGVEKTFNGETRLLVPSSRAAATYDLTPEMSAPQITWEALAAIASRKFDAIVINYANADMVGHTGRFEPTVTAVECLDRCLGEVLDATLAAGGVFLMTGDHGNAEQLTDPRTTEPHTAHTTNSVPLVIAGAGDKFHLASGGSLRDVAPTILGIMGIPKPAEMTGKDLRIPNEEFGVS